MIATTRPVVGPFSTVKWFCGFVVSVIVVLGTGSRCVAQAGQPESAAVRPFTIRVGPEVLKDLDRRLALTRFPGQVAGAGWDYGTDLDYLKGLVTYWRTQYDWRSQEKALNKWSHFKTRFEGLDLHFIHQRSRHKNALPLLLVHGWPGSFTEFQKVIGPLTDPTAHGGKAEDAFHVVIPSLPGFGFSDAPRDRGWNNDRMAELFGKLMARLGYERYGTQGGDWGASISAWLGRNRPEQCVGVHMNFVMVGAPRGGDRQFEGLKPREIARIRERRAFMAEETGYSQIQGTKPQTLGYGLNDSPAGLAAWIVEKFRTWSDCDGDLEKQFTRDELLNNVMVYWVTGSITSSTRIYYETRHSRSRGKRGRVEVPVGCAIFPKELVYAPRLWAEKRFNVTHWTEMPRGGHFAAMEEPGLLVEDVRSFFAKVR